PRAKEVSTRLVGELNTVLVEAGAPEDLIVTFVNPGRDNTQELLAHPEVNLVVATGGKGIVDLALRSGKKVIGAGAGNPPVVVDHTADIPYAAKCIVDGASFDNNLPCIAEKAIVAVDSVADLLVYNMEKHGAYRIGSPAELERLERVVLDERGNPKPEWIGQNAVDVLRAMGVDPPVGTRLLTVEVGPSHPFITHELMMPVLGLVRVRSVAAAIDLAVQIEGGNRHTAVMHSRDVTALTAMGRAVGTTIFVKNGPSFAGLGMGGEGFATFTIAGPTGEGLTSARSFSRKRRCVLVGDLHIG
ncbi:aldehyde dehydrogenase, partial [Stomatohabitans albus]